MRTLTWYLPSLYGDIRLEKKGEKETTLHYDHLSPSEVEAMLSLRARALSTSWVRTPWATKESFPAPTATGTGSLELNASILEVHKVLAKAMKPGRALVTAIRFSDGKIEEMREAELPLAEAPEPPLSVPYRELPPHEPDPQAVDAAESEPMLHPSPDDERTDRIKLKKAKPKSKVLAVAATVAAPVLGCPVPEFEKAEIRATRVLSAFLDEEQLDDFQRRQQFVSVGAETGHRYLLTSRHAREAMSRVQGRSLFDLDATDSGLPIYIGADRRLRAMNAPEGRGEGLCVHDWTVPAAEELLALHLFLSLPGREGYLRSLPEH